MIKPPKKMKAVVWSAMLIGLIALMTAANIRERWLYIKLFTINWDKSEAQVLTPGNKVYEQSLLLASTLMASPSGVRMAIGKIGVHINHHRCDGHWFYWIIRNSPLPEVNSWLFAGCADFRKPLRFREECAALLLDRTQNPACYFFLYDIASSSKTNAWRDVVGVQQARLDLSDFFPWSQSLTFYMPHDVYIPVGATRSDFIHVIQQQFRFTNSVSLF